MEPLNLLIFPASLIFLWIGGSLLVKGASGIARSTGMGGFSAGFTVVALGTSVPEFMVCLLAAVVAGSSDIAVGNMVGSNIANIGLIFGLALLVSPVTVTAEAWKQNLRPLFMLAVITAAAAGLAWWGLSIARAEGALLFLALIAFFFLHFEKPGSEETEGRSSAARSVGWKSPVYVAAGSAILAASAHFLVGSAVEIAAALGVSELYIGVAVVAVGTSLPELAASLAAAWKKEQDIIVGNIIGSNFFNLGFLGLVAALKPINVEEKMFSGAWSEFVFLFLLTALFAGLMLKTKVSGNRVGRKKGALLLALYAAFVYFISPSFS